MFYETKIFLKLSPRHLTDTFHLYSMYCTKDNNLPPKGKEDIDE